MATTKLVIKARIEELPTLAQFSIDALTRDMADFTTYKPAKYGGAFLPNLQTAKTTVEAIVNPKQLTAELKVITARIITNEIALRPLLDRLEGYVRDATGLTIGKKDFGISPVRKKITNDDQEGLDGALHYLENNITNNLAALQAVGYPPADQTALTTIHGQINSDNAAQNAKEDARALLVQNNIGVINTLAQTLKDLWADGKSLYKTANKVKLKDYTNAQLIDRIRQDELKTKVAGIDSDILGHGLNKVKIVAKPVLGGRSKTAYSAANGSYALKGLKPQPYNVTFTLSGMQPVVSTVTPVTAETVTLSVQMHP